MPTLYGLHDRDAHPHVPSGGWCVESIALSQHPQPENWSAIRGDLNWILRLNYAHNGVDGTIPLPGQYDQFAKMCSDYMRATKGVQWLIVGNEPNHAQEAPQGQRISPEQYADCYNRCYAAIKGVAPQVSVLVAAVAPWDNSSGMDFLAYYQRMLNSIEACDGFAIHGYTHGNDPGLIYSQEQQHGWYWHFPIIYQQIGVIPNRFVGLPTHVTETDQGDDAWRDKNSGWVQNAYESIHGHNNLHAPSWPIMSLSLYRWRGDKYELYNKPQVMADYNAAAAKGYASPTPSTPPNGGQSGGNGTTPPTPPTPPTPTLQWDPRLTTRGVELKEAQGQAGQVLTKCIYGKWFDEDEAEGRVNTYITLLDEQGNLIVGEEVEWYWSSGQEVKRTEVKQDPWLGQPYSLDFAMYNVAPSYGVVVLGGLPSDDIWGLGLGSIEQPHHKIHTAYHFIFQRTTTSPTPEPEPAHTEYVIAAAGANLRVEPVSGAILVAVPYAEAVSVDGTTQGADGYTWKSSAYQGHKGWIRGDLLSEQRPRPPVPPTPGPEAEVVHPCPGATITTHYGEPAPEYIPGLWGHSGTDLAAPQGTPIFAIASGTVDTVGFEPEGLGNHVRIYHPQSNAYSVYGHCLSVDAIVGKVVQRGQLVALVGSTGNSTGPHCHLEIRLGDGAGGYSKLAPMPQGRCDPETWMSERGVKL